jgi:hypothetical protein
MLSRTFLPYEIITARLLALESSVDFTREFLINIINCM